MGRIPEDELTRLKKEVSVASLATARGIELKRHGADLLGLCPFHDDRSPSLVITESSNLWHCLGACNAGGSVIDWVMRAEGVSFRHAVELLRDGFPSLAATAPRAASARKLPPPVRDDAGDVELLAQVARFYNETLKKSPEALAYLKKRGLASSEIIDRFQIGYANRTLGYRLPMTNRKSGAEIRGRLSALGVMRESGHEHLNGCVVFPVASETGEILSMYGRRITSARNAGPPHLYLPGPHRGVWNVNALAAAKEVILCEAIIDALTFWCAGFRNVTASYGVNGFTDDHFEAFRKHGTRRVLIAYDRDEAGEKAAAELAPRLIAAGIEVFRVHFPKGMDANDYALAVRPADRSLGLAIRKAVWMGQGPAPAAEPGGALAVASSCPSMEIATKSRGEVSTENGPAAKDEAPARTPDVVPETVSLGPCETPPGEVSSLAAAVAPSAGSPPSTAPVGTSLRVDEKEEELVLSLGDRRYRVRGLAKNTSFEALKVNILAAKGDAFHVDTLDLYSARARGVFVAQAARELGIEEAALKQDLARVLAKLEELQESAIKKAVEPKRKAPAISDADNAAAMELLKDPRLLERILADFTRCGVVGEETNKLVGYLAAVSRKLEAPLAIVIQSSSAAGKSSLMEAVLAFAPEEDRVKYSAMTGQSLFYIGENDLAHKILAVVEEKGAERASYSLKLLQSEGELSIASTGKDPATGRLVTHEYRVQGPVMIFLTTTAIDIDEEMLNRCIVLTVDEEREQTRAIHRIQRERQTLEGLLAGQDRSRILKRHQDAQRLLRPLLVANPYARELTFLDDRTRTRRDHVKYLTLIRTIALLHQHQRPVKKIQHEGREVEYIEATAADVALANRLAHEVLGRSLDDLAPQTRNMLMLLDRMVSEKSRQLKMERPDYRFTRRDVREHTGMTDFQVRVHLDRLVSMEYALVHHGARGQSYVYELLYDGKGKDGRPFLAGLIDAESLGAKYGEKIEGQNRGVEGPSSPHRALIEGPLKSPDFRTNAKPAAELRALAPARVGNAHPAASRNGTYVGPQSHPLAAHLAPRG